MDDKGEKLTWSRKTPNKQPPQQLQTNYVSTSGMENPNRTN